jgi:hypothetical protein
VARQRQVSGEESPVFLDVGCGFPPLTTSDTARTLSDWRVFGVDRSFADYVIYDNEGNYACFDGEGAFQYFQPTMSQRGRSLYEGSEAAREQFNILFNALFPLLQGSDGAMSETVEKDGARLIHNHIRDFEEANLAFVESDMMSLELPPAQVIRCMNVLIYFKPEIRKEMVLQAGRMLHDGGALIAGTNGLGMESRYMVYEKKAGEITPQEFAFSLDNLGHIGFMPWFTIHENDPEANLLADLTATIRADGSFWPEFSNRVDELLEHQGVCRRGSDGFLHFPEERMSVVEYIGKMSMLWGRMEEEGYLEGAASILERSGCDAWKNSVGDIAVRPPLDF